MMLTEIPMAERQRLARGMINAIQEGDPQATKSWAKAYLGTDRPSVEELMGLPWHIREFHADQDRAMRAIASSAAKS
jgi:hypothetical protein